MSVNYTSIAKQVSTALAGYGLSVTFSRAGTTLFTTTGVFTNSVEADTAADPISGISVISSMAKTIFIPGSVSSRPRNGDTFTCSLGTFTVEKVTETNPGGTPLLYEIEGT